MELSSLVSWGKGKLYLICKTHIGFYGSRIDWLCGYDNAEGAGVVRG